MEIVGHTQLLACWPAPWALLRGVSKGWRRTLNLLKGSPRGWAELVVVLGCGPFRGFTHGGATNTVAALLPPSWLLPCNRR